MRWYNSLSITPQRPDSDKCLISTAWVLARSCPANRLVDQTLRFIKAIHLRSNAGRGTISDRAPINWYGLITVTQRGLMECDPLCWLWRSGERVCVVCSVFVNTFAGTPRRLCVLRREWLWHHSSLETKWITFSRLYCGMWTSSNQSLFCDWGIPSINIYRVIRITFNQYLFCEGDHLQPIFIVSHGLHSTNIYFAIWTSFNQHSFFEMNHNQPIFALWFRPSLICIAWTSINHY